MPDISVSPMMTISETILSSVLLFDEVASQQSNGKGPYQQHHRHAVTQEYSSFQT
jgi:hypothetical protein